MLGQRILPACLRSFWTSVPSAGAQLVRRSNKIRISSQKDESFVVGYSTAGSYNLYDLYEGLRVHGIYQILPLSEDLANTVLAVKSDFSDSEKEIFFFGEKGSVVFWNVPELERETVLQFLKPVEIESYTDALVREEAEMLKVVLNESSQETLLKEGVVNLCSGVNSLEKYAFSDAISASVKLGVLEASLHELIDSIEHISEDLKTGRSIKLTRQEVLQKTGEVFALRHVINLACELLDTPDFYWDREKLESLYCATCGHLALNKRTRIYNEKLSHCADLLELITAHLNDVHHVRLEWFIIILIMIEVAFEVLHFVEKFVSQ